MIVIDPGHGGIDTGGGTNALFKEKDLVLEISKYQERRFKELGIPVVLTRTTDEYVGPAERTKRVNSAFGGDTNALVISNHINADKSILDGVDIIYSIYDSSALADSIASGFVEAGQNVRGVYTRKNSAGADYYYIIRNTRPRQTTLIEYGFADSPKDDVMQLEYDWPTLAESVVKQVTEFLGKPYTPPTNFIYIVRKGDTLSEIAKKFNTTADAIARLNNISTSKVLQIGDQLIVPYNDYADQIPSGNTYTVKPDDTLFLIAKKFNTTVNAITTLNNLSGTIIYPGQVLLIPSETDSNTSQNYFEYVVRSGDTLFMLANRFSTTVNDIKQANSLTSDVIRIGQLLSIPIPYGLFEYKVVSGDSLFSIAKKYGVGVQDIMTYNALSTSLIYPGQILLIPRK